MTSDILGLMGQYGIPLSPSMQDMHTQLGAASPYQPGPTLAGPQMTPIAGMAGQASDPLASTVAPPQVPMQGAQPKQGLTGMQKAVGIGSALESAQTPAPQPGQITRGGSAPPLMGLLGGMAQRSGIPSLFGGGR